MANRICTRLSVLALVLAAGCAAPADRPSPTDMERGGDLYRASCNACHTAQVHWRDQRLVRSWDDLVYQVSRWQGIVGLQWGREEIRDVAAYLNRAFYDLPCPQTGCGSAALPSEQATSPAPRPSRSAPRRIS